MCNINRTNRRGVLMSETLRPGGIPLTERALELISLKSGARVLDVGCGGGATVSLLRELGFSAHGVDNALASGSPPWLILADAASLPFLDSGMDAVFFEGSLSKISCPEAALLDARRVLAPGGRLIISDLFTRGGARDLSGLLGRLEPWSVILSRVERAGFKLRCFEEHGDALTSFWGQLIFDHGLKESRSLVCDCADELKSPENSYFLAVFEVT